MSDLCWTCQKNNNIILKSQNKPALEKSAVLQDQLEHLGLPHKGIQYYRSQCQLATKSAVSFQSAFEKNLPALLTFFSTWKQQKLDIVDDE